MERRLINPFLRAVDIEIALGMLSLHRAAYIRQPSSLRSMLQRSFATYRSSLPRL